MGNVGARSLVLGHMCCLEISLVLKMGRPPPNVNSMLIQTYKKKMTLLHDGKKKFQHKIPKVWEETLTNDDLQGTQVTNYYYFVKPNNSQLSISQFFVTHEQSYVALYGKLSSSRNVCVYIPIIIGRYSCNLFLSFDFIKLRVENIFLSSTLSMI